MENRREEQSRRGMPLRFSIVLLFLSCWVLPILLLVGVVGRFSEQANVRLVEEVATATVQRAMDQISTVLDVAIEESQNVSYMPTIRMAYMQYQQDGNGDVLYETAKTHLVQQFSRSRVNAAVYLVFPDVDSAGENDCYTYNSTVQQTHQAQVFYTNGAREIALEQMPQLGTGMAFFMQEGRLYGVRNLSLRDNAFTPYAILVNEITMERIYRSLDDLGWDMEVDLRLDGIALTAPTGDHSIRPLAAERQVGRQEYLVQGAVETPRYSLAYQCLLDLTPMMNETTSPWLLMAGILLLSIPLAALVLIFLMRQVGTPIEKLSEFAGRIEKGELGAQMDAHTLESSEFRYLGQQMNTMSARLKEQFERLYVEELALQDARIKALQSQINPHFLGNTLETINWEARMAGDEKVSKMLEALSTLMHAGLARNQRPLVYLAEELTYIDAYLYIIRERLGERLTIVTEIEEKLLNWYVPRLILQPVVENAVDHGVERQEQGTIVIRAKRVDDGWMRLEVENDSAMAPEDEENVRKLLSGTREAKGFSNIGISNVHQRLRILYGERGGLTIQNRGNCTVATMMIQYPEAQQEEPEQESRA